MKTSCTNRYAAPYAVHPEAPPTAATGPAPIVATANRATPTAEKHAGNRSLRSNPAGSGPVVAAVPHDARPVHDHAVGDGADGLHGHEGAQDQQNGGHDVTSGSTVRDAMPGVRDPHAARPPPRGGPPGPTSGSRG